MELLFASHNRGKSREIQELLGDHWELKNLHDLGIKEAIEESGETLEENAFIKAKYLFSQYKTACFADDSGLEVKALGGKPGVYSARYAGTHKSDADNMNLLLSNLEGLEDRTARFRTVIAYINSKGEAIFFDGSVKGTITIEKKGSAGFGYDPVFQPERLACTFAEMSLEEKNDISHRAIATNALISFLNSSK